MNNRFFIAITLLMVCAGIAYSASTAKQVDFLQAGLEQSGNALSGGKVYTYESGTTTAKECYLDRAKASPATNPVVLDTEGRATVFCDGIYKMVVKSSLDVTLITMDGLDYGNTGLQVTALSSYEGLEEAVNDIGATKTVLMIDTTDTLNSNITVPANITLAAFARDAITLNSKTLTVNGDIWAGAFEWIIGSGTFTGSPVVQFYDPTWTASTVTDSATPSYKNLTLSEPTLLTPVIADFSNATHIHNGASQGGGTLTDVTINGAANINSTGYINSPTLQSSGNNVLIDQNFLQGIGSSGLTIGTAIDIANISLGSVSVGDKFFVAARTNGTKDASAGYITISANNSGTSSVEPLNDMGGSISYVHSVNASNPWNINPFLIYNVSTAGTLSFSFTATSTTGNATNVSGDMGVLFIRKQ